MTGTAWRRVAVLGLAAAALLTACQGAKPSAKAAAAKPVASSGTAGPSSTDDFGPPVTNPADPSATSVAPAGSTTFPADPNPTTLSAPLRSGSKGDDVQRLQQRLIDLKFDPGKPDGVFGTTTAQAVWAFQKLILGQKPTGVVTPDVWNAMEGAVTIAPRRTDTTDTHLEVYLPQQVAVLFKSGLPELVTHISSGTGKQWCGQDKSVDPPAPICGMAVTPGGIFKFYRRESDWHEGKLGKLYNPVYFNYGIAVHGMTSVPNYPASHGCVRIPMHIAAYFPDLVKKGDQVFVWDGVKEPEAYGAQPPPFDQPDPNASTTTTAPSTTTTTAKATTTTTPKPSTTATTKPASTTTTVKPTTTTKAPATTAPKPPPTTVKSTTTT